MNRNRTHFPDRRSSNRRGGFSLVEIMVVVVIIGLMAGVVVINVIPRIQKARFNKAKADIATFSTALDLYKLDKGKYPSSGDGLKTLASDKGKYLKGSVPKDPWGNEYVYLYPGQNGEDYNIESYGEDSSDGGGDDVESWNMNADQEEE